MLIIYQIVGSLINFDYLSYKTNNIDTKKRHLSLKRSVLANKLNHKNHELNNINQFKRAIVTFKPFEFKSSNYLQFSKRPKIER